MTGTMPAPEAEARQRRTPITDGAHGEPWVWRYKDLRGWWENPHHERIDGVRQAVPTDWVPRSKPFWFTELRLPGGGQGDQPAQQVRRPEIVGIRCRNIRTGGATI
jgi:hypothetical protein